MANRFRDELPSRTYRKFDWDSAVSEAMKQPGRWYMAFKNATDNQAKTVREREVNALRTNAGTFEAAIRNSRRGVGELWIRFTPADDDAAILDQMEEAGDL